MRSVAQRLRIVLLCIAGLSACSPGRRLSLPPRPATAESGSDFYKSVFTVDRAQREQAASREILAGNVPPFLRSFVPIEASIAAPDGRRIDAVYYVLPDYLSIGSDSDFARIPLTPMTAQTIADQRALFSTDP